MPLPPAPSGDNFSPQKVGGGRLIGLKALRIEQRPSLRDGQPVETIFLDVWMLDGPEAGRYWSNSQNQSNLGRQFRNEVGSGEVFYGRLAETRVSAGTSITLVDPDPADQPTIDAHRNWLISQGLYGQPQPAAPPAQPPAQNGFTPPTQQAPPPAPAPAAAPAYNPNPPAPPWATAGAPTGAPPLPDNPPF